MRHHSLRLRLSGLLGALALAGALVPLATTSAHAAGPGGSRADSAAALSFRVDTGGPALNVRNCPRLSCSIAGTIPNGTVVPVDCQTTGDRVTGHLGTSNIWDVIGNLGYASDTNINTGVDGFHPGLPRC